MVGEQIPLRQFNRREITDIRDRGTALPLDGRPSSSIRVFPASLASLAGTALTIRRTAADVRVSRKSIPQASVIKVAITGHFSRGLEYISESHKSACLLRTAMRREL